MTERHPDMIRVKNSNRKEVSAPAWGHDRQTLQTERRTYERFPSNLQVRLCYGNMIYAGMVTNISRKGMFVTTKVNFPVNTEFMMVLLLDDRTVKIPIRVKRSVKKQNGYYSGADSGIGVEIKEAPQRYLDYVGSRKSSMQISY